MVLIVQDWKVTDCAACKRSFGNGLGDRLPFQKIQVDAKPFNGCSSQRWEDCGAKSQMIKLYRLKEGKGEWFEDREHVGDLLGHAKHVFHVLATNGGAFDHSCEHLPVAMHLVGGNAKAGGCRIESNTQYDALLLQCEGFVQVVQGG